MSQKESSQISFWKTGELESQNFNANGRSYFCVSSIISEVFRQSSSLTFKWTFTSNQNVTCFICRDLSSRLSKLCRSVASDNSTLGNIVRKRRCKSSLNLTQRKTRRRDSSIQSLMTKCRFAGLSCTNGVKTLIGQLSRIFIGKVWRENTWKSLQYLPWPPWRRNDPFCVALPKLAKSST